MHVSTVYPDIILCYLLGRMLSPSKIDPKQMHTKKDHGKSYDKKPYVEHDTDK